MGLVLPKEEKWSVGKSSQDNTGIAALLGLIAGQMKTGQQTATSAENVPGDLPEGVDPEDFRQVPKVREVGGVLTQQPEWERKEDPDRTEADVVMQIDRTLDLLGWMKDEFKEGKYQTGPLQWRWSDKLPGSSTYMKIAGTPEEQSFKQINQRMLQAYLLAQSGVQRGFKEITWLSSAIPNTEQNPEAFLESIDTFTKELGMNRQNVVGHLRQRGKAVGGIKDYFRVVPEDVYEISSNQPKAKTPIPGISSGDKLKSQALDAIKGDPARRKAIAEKYRNKTGEDLF